METRINIVKNLIDTIKAAKLGTGKKKSSPIKGLAPKKSNKKIKFIAPTGMKKLVVMPTTMSEKIAKEIAKVIPKQKGVKKDTIKTRMEKLKKEYSSVPKEHKKELKKLERLLTLEPDLDVLSIDDAGSFETDIEAEEKYERKMPETTADIYITPKKTRVVRKPKKVDYSKGIEKTILYKKEGLGFKITAPKKKMSTRSQTGGFPKGPIIY